MYIANLPSDNSLIGIKHGETQYRPFDSEMNQAWADKYNKSQGHSKGQIEAALQCSMFGCWNKFNVIAKEYDES